MNTNNYSYKPQYVAKSAAAVKTVRLQFGIADGDLEEKIKQAFALAKSAGRELSLTFGACHPNPSNAQQYQAPLG